MDGMEIDLKNSTILVRYSTPRGLSNHCLKVWFYETQYTEQFAMTKRKEEDDDGRYT